MAVLFLIFWVPHTIFHSGCINLHPTDRSQGLLFLYIPTQQRVPLICDDSYCDRGEGISHGGFHLHSPDDQWSWACFCVPLDHLYTFFGKCLLGSSAHFFIRFLFLLLRCMNTLCVLDVNLLLDINLHIFPPYYRLPFHFVDYFFCCAEVF